MLGCWAWALGMLAAVVLGLGLMACIGPRLGLKMGLDNGPQNRPNTKIGLRYGLNGLWAKQNENKNKKNN